MTKEGSLLRAALLSRRRRPRILGAGAPSLTFGEGYEFAELREYVPGDDPRRIDWAATARSRTLQTRVMNEDVALTFAAVVDRSASMNVGRNRALSASATDALRAWYGAALAEDRCTVIAGTDLFGGGLVRGMRAGLACLDASQAIATIADSLRTVDAALPRASALLVISDFFAPPLDPVLLRRLGHRHDCTVLIARDPWHDGLPLRGFVTVSDSESRERKLVYIGKKERERYRVATHKREADLTNAFTNAGWRTGYLVEADGVQSLYEAFGIGRGRIAVV